MQQVKTVSISERKLFASPATPVIVAAATSTDAIIDQTVEPKNLEIVNRYVQNNSGDIMYYAFAQNATPNNYHGILPQYAQLDCSAHRLRVNVYSAGGGAAAVTIIYRNEGIHNTIIPNSP